MLLLNAKKRKIEELSNDGAASITTTGAAPLLTQLPSHGDSDGDHDVDTDEENVRNT